MSPRHLQLNTASFGSRVTSPFHPSRPLTLPGFIFGLDAICFAAPGQRGKTFDSPSPLRYQLACEEASLTRMERMEPTDDVESSSTSTGAMTPEGSEPTENAMNLASTSEVGEIETADGPSNARRRNSYDDLDTMLALQMSLADSDMDDEDFANFAIETFRLRDFPFPTDGSHPHPTSPPTPESPPRYEDDNEALARGISASLTPDTSEPWRSPEPRNRYDVANVDTYRTDPRRNGGYYARFGELAIPCARSADRLVSRSTQKEESCPYQSRQGQQKLPILNPAVGAPLLNMLGKDELACIVDHLYFPDAFAFAMTCKTVQNAINLKLKKQAYRKALPLRDGTICNVCLYSLPGSYFLRGVGSASKMLKDEPVASSVCTDCLEFRARVKAHDEVTEVEVNEGEGCKWDRHQLASPVWRPSGRAVVPDSGGFLWYRQRD